MVSEPTPTASFSAGAADTVILEARCVPPLQWTVTVVEPALGQSPASLTLFAFLITLTEPGGAGVTDETVFPDGQAGRLTAVSTPSGTVGS